tara:strand:- start:171 stop:887 length:717 start_codon:yes stop_codon:yes gene_type:complete
MANICCVIPARLNSSRFDRKLLKKINDVPLLEFVRRKVMQSFLSEDIFIATGDKEIEKINNKYGGNTIKSKKKHKDGTSRVIEAIKNLNYKNVLIVQGDEPLVSKKILNKFKKTIINNPKIKSFNYVTKLKKKKDIYDENVVKCVLSKDNNIVDAFRKNNTYQFKDIYKLQGIFSFNRKFLLNLKNLKQNKRQKIEKIEQLRIILSKNKLKAIIGDEDYQSVNTLDDFILVKKILNCK